MDPHSLVTGILAGFIIGTFLERLIGRPVINRLQQELVQLADKIVPTKKD